MADNCNETPECCSGENKQSKCVFKRLFSRIRAFFTGTDGIPDEAVKFQPDALEIKNERLPLGVRLCVWTPVVVIVVLILWSIFAKVDVIVPANGQFVTGRPTIVMKPLERTVIKEIKVKIGQEVKANEILIVFDPTESRAEAERLSNEISAMSAEFARLTAEFSGKDYRPAGADNFEKWQLAIFAQRKAYFSERILYFDESLSQIEASTKAAKDSLDKQEERLKAVRKLEEMYQNLHDKKITSLKELIQMQITRMEMEATVDQLRNSLLELNHRHGSTLAEKNSFVQEWRNSISEKMVEVERNLTSARKQHEKVRQLIEYVCLRSPCDAVVHEIASFSPGSAVREAEALITLIPLEGDIELEGRLRPMDIGKVKIGDEVRVKLDAYPFQKYGTLSGVVRNISEDTIKDPNAARAASAEEAAAQLSTYYRVMITVSGKLRNVGEDFRLVPGMQAQGEIKTGKRRVIEYVLYPLIKALDESAREP